MRGADSKKKERTAGLPIFSRLERRLNRGGGGHVPTRYTCGLTGAKAKGNYLFVSAGNRESKVGKPYHRGLVENVHAVVDRGRVCQRQRAPPVLSRPVPARRVNRSGLLTQERGVCLFDVLLTLHV